MVPGVRRRTLAAGERLMQMHVELAPGATVPEHQHPHEQMSHVLRGSIRFELGAAGATHLAHTLELTEGDTLSIPGDVPHGATASSEGALLIETFSPPREDLLAKDVAASVNVPPTTPSVD